jgi:hypothetical protein
MTPPRSYPEVKESDIACSGFIRDEDVPNDLKVIGRYPDDQAHATEGDYVYIGRGAEGGIRPGATYEVIRHTKNVRGLGMHYLEVARVQIVMGQADHSLARITQGCETGGSRRHSRPLYQGRISGVAAASAFFRHDEAIRPDPRKHRHDEGLRNQCKIEN